MMARRITNQIGTILVVILVIFFCASGMVSSAHGAFTPDSSAENPAGGPTPPAPPQPTEAPSSPAASDSPSAPPETQPIQLTAAPEGYFEDALFIGDSRTVGLQEYGSLPGASFFATSGMSVYSIFYEEVANTSFSSLMQGHRFGKIYVMLGINELGYDLECTVSEYKDLIEWIRLCQPEAMIYIEANLHVSAERSQSDRIYNNANLDAFNDRISDLADGKQIFYLDVNPLFDDGAGNLADAYTVDNTHVLGKYYRTWSDWIAENAAVKSPQSPAITENGE